MMNEKIPLNVGGRLRALTNIWASNCTLIIKTKHSDSLMVQKNYLIGNHEPIRTIIQYYNLFVKMYNPSIGYYKKEGS